MKEFDIKSARFMVKQQQGLGNDVRWDGWDIVFWRPDDRGASAGVEKVPGGKTMGAYRNGQWGFENRFIVDERGIWSVDARNIKHPRRPRNRR